MQSNIKKTIGFMLLTIIIILWPFIQVSLVKKLQNPQNEYIISTRNYIITNTSLDTLKYITNNEYSVALTTKYLENTQKFTLTYPQTIDRMTVAKKYKSIVNSTNTTISIKMIFKSTHRTTYSNQMNSTVTVQNHENITIGLNNPNIDNIIKININNTIISPSENIGGNNTIVLYHANNTDTTTKHDNNTIVLYHANNTDSGIYQENNTIISDGGNNTITYQENNTIISDGENNTITYQENNTIISDGENNTIVLYHANNTDTTKKHENNTTVLYQPSNMILNSSNSTVDATNTDTTKNHENNTSVLYQPSNMILNSSNSILDATNTKVFIHTFDLNQSNNTGIQLPYTNLFDLNSHRETLTKMQKKNTKYIKKPAIISYQTFNYTIRCLNPPFQINAMCLINQTLNQCIKNKMNGCIQTQISSIYNYKFQCNNKRFVFKCLWNYSPLNCAYNNNKTLIEICSHLKPIKI